MAKKKTQPDSWQSRIRTLLAADVRVATGILAEHGLTPSRALGYVKRGTTPMAFAFKRNTPKLLKDPTSPARYALTLFILKKWIEEAQPLSLTIGRAWSDASRGMQVSDIAKATQSWWLDKNRGKGARKENDLTRTLRVILTENPKATPEDVIAVLTSEDAEDRYHSTTAPDFHIHAVELDENQEQLIYSSRSGSVERITLASFASKLSKVRSKLRSGK